MILFTSSSSSSLSLGMLLSLSGFRPESNLENGLFSDVDSLAVD